MLLIPQVGRRQREINNILKYGDVENKQYGQEQPGYLLHGRLRTL